MELRVRLVNVHITNYRSVEDFDEFAVEPDITRLVGRTLKALCRLNLVEVAATFDEVIDFPAKRTRDRKQ